MSRAALHEVLIVGAGPAGLMAAEAAASAGARVVVCDRMASPARKFLLAGRGGLNLTHGEDETLFRARYGAASQRLARALAAFSPRDLRAWSAALGEETFVGTSGRVFPKSLKASPLLRAWLRRLASLGVELRPRHRFLGWSNAGAARFATPDGETEIEARATVLAFGGASWPRLGSDGSWAAILENSGVSIAPLKQANCGFDISWSAVLREKFAGAPLKNVLLTHAGRQARGEAVITRHGIEGGAVYALAATLRDEILRNGEATLQVDLRPDVDADRLAHRLAAPRRGQSTSTFLRKAAGLAPVAIALLREAGPLPQDQAALASRIKWLPLRLSGVRPIERAISTAGGVQFDELDDDLMLKRLPGVFAAGEMIDWEAPTGGYLLQACVSTGFVAGRAAAAWARRAA